MSVDTVASPLLARPGAVAAEGPDAGVAWHYGDPTREARLLEEGLAVVDLSHRAVVTVTGPDRLSWLHSITTQALTGLAPRTSTEALVLSPKGHVEHALHVVDDGETTWITAEPGTGDALTGWLRSMQFMLRVETTDRTADVAVLGEPVGREGADGEPVVWRDPWPTVAPGSVSYAAVEDADHPAAGRAWRELLVPRGELEAAVA
ncbi:YgfZ/GcvT domain-containing protein, partial [Angustibacter peucedani]